jgi:hypothetical protein
MKTLDLRKELKQFYAPPAKKVQLVDVPEFQFAVITGAIEPGVEPGNSPAFASAIQTLYGISYTLKFTSKLRKVDPIDYPVMALEGLWWVEEGEFTMDRKDNWSWTAMILQPEHITLEMFEEARAQVQKKQGESPTLAQLRLERFREGLCVQALHIGPYSEEPATVAKMDAFAAEQGYVMFGKHHEIYVGDPSRAAPEKLKTVLRHPVQNTSVGTDD